MGRGLRSGAVRVSWAARACSARASAGGGCRVFSRGRVAGGDAGRLRAIASAPRTEACDARVEAELEAILSECAAKAEGAGARRRRRRRGRGVAGARVFARGARAASVSPSGTDSGNLEEEGGGTSVEALLTLVRRRAFPFSARFALTVASLRVASLEDSRAVANRVSARTAWTRVQVRRRGGSTPPGGEFDRARRRAVGVLVRARPGRGGGADGTEGAGEAVRRRRDESRRRSRRGGVRPRESRPRVPAVRGKSHGE